MIKAVGIGMVWTVLAMLGMAAPARAGDFDGSKRLLCAPADIFECGPSVACQRSTPEDADVSRFLRVDFKKKRLAWGEHTAVIQNVVKKEGKTILQGAENGRGWSIVIDQKSGTMSGAISDTARGFLLFGACTAR